MTDREGEDLAEECMLCRPERADTLLEAHGVVVQHLAPEVRHVPAR